MPTVFIWYPDKNHPYGHASLQTDKYHISFWPDGDVKEDFGVAKTAVVGVPGCLVFHHELDRYEENCLPTKTYHIINATDEAINGIHEEFLRYNGIDSADVTLKEAEELIAQNEKPQVSVPKTPYTFKAKFDGQVGLNVVLDAIPLDSETNLIVKPDLGEPFYHFKQSCVSFCFNIIVRADPNPQSISSKVVDVLTLKVLDNFTVPWFESHIKRHWMNNSSLNVLDNSIVRTVRYWTWDYWTSSSQTGQAGGFRKFPADFKAKNENKGKGG